MPVQNEFFQRIQHVDVFLFWFKKGIDKAAEGRVRDILIFSITATFHRK